MIKFVILNDTAHGNYSCELLKPRNTKRTKDSVIQLCAPIDSYQTVKKSRYINIISLRIELQITCN